MSAESSGSAGSEQPQPSGVGPWVPPAGAFGDPALGLPRVTTSSEDRIAAQRDRSADLIRSTLVVLGWFVAAGLLGALVWLQVTDLPEFTRVEVDGSMGEQELGKQFGVNGWFLVIALAGGFLSGVVLPLLRRATPPLLLLGLVVLGSTIATLVMVQSGLAWGPGDPNVALATAQLGDMVPVQLKPDLDAVYYAWTVATLLGAAAVLWFGGREDQHSEDFSVRY